MFNQFIAALLQKIVTHLSENKGFKNLDELSVPEAFKNYLIQTNEEEFMADLKVILQYLQSPKTATVKNNKFFTALLGFLTSDLARKLDYIDGNFYLLSAEKRKKFVENLIKGASTLAETLRNILTNFTYQQIGEAIHVLANQVDKKPYIIVQSPREITDIELKKELR